MGENIENKIEKGPLSPLEIFEKNLEERKKRDVVGRQIESWLRQRDSSIYLKHLKNLSEEDLMDYAVEELTIKEDYKEKRKNFTTLDDEREQEKLEKEIYPLQDYLFDDKEKFEKKLEEAGAEDFIGTPFYKMMLLGEAPLDAISSYLRKYKNIEEEKAKYIQAKVIKSLSPVIKDFIENKREKVINYLREQQKKEKDRIKPLIEEYNLFYRGDRGGDEEKFIEDNKGVKVVPSGERAEKGYMAPAGSKYLLIPKEWGSFYIIERGENFYVFPMASGMDLGRRYINSGFIIAFSENPSNRDWRLTYPAKAIKGEEDNWELVKLGRIGARR